jgi:ankyrin repeat protein
MSEISLSQQLFQASINNDLEATELLLQNKNFNPFEKSNQPFVRAAQLGQLELIKLFIKYADKSFNENNQDAIDAFYDACASGHFSVVEFLMTEYNINPSEDMNQASHMAMEAESYDILDLFWKDKRIKDTLKSDEPWIYNHIKLRNFKNKVNQF